MGGLQFYKIVSFAFCFSSSIWHLLKLFDDKILYFKGPFMGLFALVRASRLLLDLLRTFSWLSFLTFLRDLMLRIGGVDGVALYEGTAIANYLPLEAPVRYLWYIYLSTKLRCWLVVLFRTYSD